MKSKNILITGGAGFIGTHLSNRLVNSGYVVTVLDNLSPQIHGQCIDRSSYNFLKDRTRFIKGDVCCREDWQKALVSQSAIIHLASETGTGQSMYDVEQYVNVNIRGTAILLDILAKEKHHIEKIILASSRAVYGEGKYQCNEDGVFYPKQRNVSDLDRGLFEFKCNLCNRKLKIMPTDEASELAPISIYGFTKLAQEQIIQLVGKALDVPYTILRYQNVFGPGQSLANPYTGILSIFSTQIKNGNDIEIYEDGQESRDFVYISDVIDATVSCIDDPMANNEIFNVGSGVALSVLDVAEALKKLYNSKINIIISGNYRIGDIRHNLADLTKIKSLLNFKPQVDFFEGIKRFSEWVNSQSINKDVYSDTISELKKSNLFRKTKGI